MEVSPYYEKKLECIHCKKTFSTYKVRTKSIKVKDTDTDFMPIYEDENVRAMYYNVFVCEHCGFSYTEDFTKYFAPGTAEEVKEKITKNWVHHDFNGERTVFQALHAYKLALLCADIKREKNVTKAGLALRLAWLYRSLKNAQQEERFLTIARDQYIESYSNEDYATTQMSGTRVVYMIAELSRRVKDYENAVRYFSKVIEGQRTGGEAKLVEMARERWEEIRTEREAQAQV